MLKYLTVFLLLCQSARSNSIQPDSAMIEEMVHKAYRIQDSYPDSAYAIAKNVYRISSKVNYSKGVAYALIRMGHIKNSWGENDTALLLINKAFHLRKLLNDNKGATSACFTLCYIYRETGKLDSAFSIMYEALRLNEQTKDSSTRVIIYSELADLNSRYNREEDALFMLQKAEQIAKRLSKKSSLLYVYSGFADYYKRRGSYKEALEYNLLANKIIIEDGSQVALLQNYNNIALCYSELKDYRLASFFYKKALEGYGELGIPLEQSLTYYNLGSLYYNIGVKDSSIYYINNAINIALEFGDVYRQSVCYKLLSEIYMLDQDYGNAYQNYVKYSLLKDSLLNEEKISSIAEIQTKYETEKKEQQIALLDQQNKAKEAEKKYLSAAAISLLLIVFVLIFLYIQRKRIAQKNELIAEQKLESLLDEQEIKTYNAMLEGQEEERMRIATDLHDRLGSMLSTVKLLFSALDEKIDKNQAENKLQYEKANSLLDEACVEVRRVSHNLGTGMVANFGLFRALEELCESIDQSGKIKCSIQAFGLEDSLKINIEVGIYRMVQEVFNNALKYSRAKKLSLQLNHQEEMISIMIEDDGIGFDLLESKKKGGMGLSNLEMRANKLGGELHIDTKPGRGTTTIIEIPINTDA